MVKQKENNIAVVTAASRHAWRNWLKKNSQKLQHCWLVIYHLHSAHKSVYYNEAVEEAICFGWIDSKPAKRDEESYLQFFAKRKPSSNWSRANRERAEKMIRDGLMTAAGQELIDLAKQTGKWEVLESVQQNNIPPDLRIALSKNKKAKLNFEGFPPSSKRIILEWILQANQPETRKKRIDETVAKAADNLRANHYRQPKHK